MKSESHSESELLESVTFIFPETAARARFISSLFASSLGDGMKEVERLVPPGGVDYCLSSEVKPDIAMDLVVVEDEFDHILNLLRAARASLCLRHVVVCATYQAIESLLDKAPKAPRLVTLDFLLGSEADLESGRTAMLHTRLLQVWPQTAIVAITNFETKGDMPLIETIRNAGGSVYDKARVWQALPTILRDCLRRTLSRSTSTNHHIAETPHNALAHRTVRKPGVSEKLNKEVPSISNQDEARFLKLKMPLIGTSDAIQRIKAFILRESRNEGMVLLLGERGTGKEVVARAIHELGPRYKKPFVAVNCATLSAEMFEAQMFGIKSGVATNVVAHAGYFEQAHEGTLFLDEIGEMPLEFQAKLLRVLSPPYEYMRVGGNAQNDKDTLTVKGMKIVLATNRPLQQMVADGSFRGDLFDRMRGARFFPDLPPLADRKEDIFQLVDYVMLRHPEFSLGEGVMRCLVDHHWPGNIRELISVIEKAVDLADAFGKQLITVDFVQEVIGDQEQPAVEPATVTQGAATDKAARILEEMEAAILRLGCPRQVTREALAAAMNTLEKGKRGYAPATLSTLLHEYDAALRHLLNSPSQSLRWPCLRRAYRPIAKMISK